MGAVLVVIGAVLTFLPFLSAGSATGAAEIQSKSIYLDSHYVVHWTGGASSSDYVAAVDCGASQPGQISQTSGLSQVCSGSSGVLLGSGTGSSGSFPVSAPAGHWVVIAGFTSASGPLDVTPTGGVLISATATEGYYGEPILFLGMVVLLLGVALKSHKPRGTTHGPSGPRDPSEGARDGTTEGPSSSDGRPPSFGSSSGAPPYQQPPPS